MSTPRFSVVIPCFNQGAFLAECLASVRAQSLPAAEIIVVDDGSTDPWSVRRIRELCAPPVVLVAQENRGLSGARNAGVRRATGDWIVPLDADDQLTADALEQYAQAIARDPTVDVWYPDVQHFGLRDDAWVAPEFNAWRLLSTNTMVGAGSAIRRGVFESGVLYDERMRSGYEDWEFYVHACCERDFRGRALARPLLRYRRWGHSMLASANTVGDELRAQIRAQRPVYRDEARLIALKRRESPFFAVAARTPSLGDALAAQSLLDWRLVDDGDRIAREGGLGAFHGALGRSLLVSLDDPALARCLRDDRMLLEKLAATVESASPAAVWLVTAEDGAAAYPGLLTRDLGERASCIAFALSTRCALGAPGFHRSGSLAEDLARHLEAVAPGGQLAVIAGRRAGPEGAPVPAEVRSQPAHPRRAPERAVLLRESATRLAQAVVGPDRFARIERTRAYAALRSLARGQGLHPPSASDRRVAVPPLAPDERAGPLSPGQLGDRGHLDAALAIAQEPARYRARPPSGTPTLLVAAPSIGHGGAGRAVADLLDGIARVAPGVRRYLLVSEPAGMTWADRVLPLVEGFIPLVGPAEGHAGQVRDWVGRLAVDALLVVSCQAAFDALPTIRRLPRQVRVAARLHGFDRDHEPGELAGWPVYATSRYDNLIDQYLAASRSVADRLTDRLYVSPTKIRVVYPGLDVQRFAGAHRERAGAAPARALWLGRLAPEKDPAMAVRVAAAWKAKHGASTLRLTIAGGGPLDAEVRDLVRALRVDDVVELAGPVDDPVPVYREADLLILTSRCEGIPIVVCEAMAAGLPVVTAREHTSIPEVLPREQAWYVADRADPAAYVAQLEAILRDPAGARRVADLNAAAARRFGLERHATEMIEGLLPGVASAHARADANG